MSQVRLLAESDEELPPIVVLRSSMRVIDGMHRLRAAELRGERYITVRFVDCDDEDAFVLAVRLNVKHGLPLTKEERLSAAERCIESNPHWSDRRLAEVTGLGAATIAMVRRRSTGNVTQLNARTGRDGRRRPTNPAEGRRRAGRIITEWPDAPLRLVAQRAGVALATARDVRERLRRGADPVPPKLRAAEEARAAVADEATEGAGAAPESEPSRAVLPLEVRPSSRARSCDDASRGGCTVSASLARDDPPSCGVKAVRELLTWLQVNSMDPAQRQRLIEDVPPDCAPGIVQAARQCADYWMEVAWEVERRIVTP